MTRLLCRLCFPTRAEKKFHAPKRSESTDIMRKSNIFTLEHLNSKTEIIQGHIELLRTFTHSLSVCILGFPHFIAASGTKEAKKCEGRYECFWCLICNEKFNESNSTGDAQVQSMNSQVLQENFPASEATCCQWTRRLTIYLTAHCDSLFHLPASLTYSFHLAIKKGWNTLRLIITQQLVASFLRSLSTRNFRIEHELSLSNQISTWNPFACQSQACSTSLWFIT